MENKTKMYEWVFEKSDLNKIRKLVALKNPKTFWDDVRKLTKRVTSDHSIKRWQILAELRYSEIQNGG